MFGEKKKNMVVFTFVFFPLLHDALILDNNNLSGSVPSELFAIPNVYIYVLIDVSKWIW